MKANLYTMLCGLLAGTAFAQYVEPYGGSAKPHPLTVIFNADMADLEKRVIDNLNQLQGVKVDSVTGKAQYEKRPLPAADTVFSKESEPAKNIAQMNREIITVWWRPPKPRPQKISGGGRNVIPPRSRIDIVIGCLKANRNATVVQIVREWTYNERSHVPHTEIPLWRANSTDSGSYASDHIWLHALMPGKEVPPESDEAVYDSKVLQVLKSLPSAAPPVKTAAPSGQSTAPPDKSTAAAKESTVPQTRSSSPPDK
jgi:hypothetical protein